MTETANACTLGPGGIPPLSENHVSLTERNHTSPAERRPVDLAAISFGWAGVGVAHLGAWMATRDAFERALRDADQLRGSLDRFEQLAADLGISQETAGAVLAAVQGPHAGWPATVEDLEGASAMLASVAAMVTTTPPRQGGEERQRLQKLSDRVTRHLAASAPRSSWRCSCTAR
ncbi:hypothetical protein [Streptomyces sp. Midd1]|uniref:hypothetical protein n=1 Tax=Streptomyces sp. Midd3 TaxID=3161191 RepID=UPI0034DB5A9B